MNRRSIVRGGALGAAGLAGAVLIGCGDDENGGTDDSGTPVGSGTPGTGGTPAGGGGAPVAGGTINFGLSSDLASLEPHVFIQAHTDSLWHVWDQLVRYDANLEPEGILFESWEINDDFTEITFHVRPGVTWHSGRDFTAEDVVWNFERVQNPELGFGLLRTMASWFDRVEATDEMTVVLGSDVPRPATFDLFESFNMGDRESLEAADPSVAIGTGAFKLGEWRPGESFNLLKNESYWRSGRPVVDEQFYNVGIEPQTLIAQFESGALHVVPRPAIRDFVRYRDSGSHQAITHQSSGAYYAVGYNTTLEPFNDVRVRQGLTYAFDKARFAETVLLGTIEPYSLPWGPASIAYEEEKRNHYLLDLEKSRQLLDAAGINGLDFEIMMTPENPEMPEMSQIFQQDLASLDLGINLSIRPVETALFVDTINAQPPQHQGMYFANASRANLGSPLTMFTSTSVLWGTTQHEDGFGINNTGYYSEAYAGLIDQLLLASDPEEQRELYSQLNDLVLEDNWISFVGPKPPRIIAQNDVQNIVQWPATEGFHYMDASIDA